MDDVQKLRQTTYSYIYNQNILFDQREAEIRQEREEEYQRDAKERRQEQWTNYQKSFDALREGLSPKAESIETINNVERQVFMGLFGEQARSAELAQEQQKLFDQKRLNMAHAQEEQISHDIRAVTKAVAKEVETNPSKFKKLTAWDAHVAYFNAKWNAEGFSVSEPYSIVVGTPPINLMIPSGQVAHAINAPVDSGVERLPDYTQEGLLQESRLAQLISTHPERMGDILMSNHHFNSAQPFAESLREIWETHSPDDARDSILLLCSSTLNLITTLNLWLTVCQKRRVFKN